MCPSYALRHAALNLIVVDIVTSYRLPIEFEPVTPLIIESSLNFSEGWTESNQVVRFKKGFFSE